MHTYRCQSNDFNYGVESSFWLCVCVYGIDFVCNTQSNILSNRRLFDFKEEIQPIRSSFRFVLKKKTTWNDKWKQNFIKKNWTTNLKNEMWKWGLRFFFSSFDQIRCLHTQKMRSIKWGGFLECIQPFLKIKHIWSELGAFILDSFRDCLSNAHSSCSTRFCLSTN